MPSVPIQPIAYLAALGGNWDRLIEYYDGERIERVWFPITLAGDNALHIAVYSQREIPLESLVDKFVTETDGDAKSLLKITNYFGNTPLHEAVFAENVKAVKYLATRYPDLESAVNDMGETPLFQAASYSDIKVVECLASTDDKDSRSQPTAGQQQDPNLPSGPATELQGSSLPDIQDSNSQPAAGRHGRLRDIHLKRKDGTSILHAAVQAGRFETALLLLNLDESLKDLVDTEGKTALHYLAAMPSAFKSGYSLNIFTKFLYYLAPVDDNNYNKNEKTTPPQPCWVCCPEACSSYFNKPDIEGGQSRNPQDQHYCRSIYSYVQKVLQAINLLLWKYLLQGWPFFEDLYDSKQRHGFALRLAKSLIKNDYSWYDVSVESYAETPPIRQAQPGEPKSGGHEVDKNDDQQRIDIKEDTGIPLFIATRTGILEIVKEILTNHPMAVEYINDERQNILLLSVLHRRKDIFDLVRSLSIPLARLRRGIDNNGHTLLHQVADTAHYTRETGLEPALQLKRELELLESARALIPSHYVMRRDVNNMTADELFAKNHKRQLTEAQKWLKDTCQSSSTVAVLVAGVVFAAGFTVPGGSDSSGIPNHLCSNYFTVFVIMDVVSLATSLTSVVMFLSAATSPRELHEFGKSIPRKLMLGFALLFFSVMTTMAAFGTAVFILLQSEKQWTNWLIYIAAIFPILVFAVVQFRMYVAFGAIMLDYLQTIAHSLIPGFAALSRWAKTTTLLHKKLFK